MVLAVCLGSAPLLASMGPRKADSIQTGAPLKQHALFSPVSQYLWLWRQEIILCLGVLF